MKKAIFVITALLMTTFFSFAGSGKGGLKVGDKSNGCTGSGICGITHTSTGVAANFVFNIQNNSFVISFSANDLMRVSPEMAQNLEGRTTLMLLTPVDVDTELSRTLGADGLIIIPKGTYSVTESDGIYTITVPNVQISYE
jgi:hypothetical protein